MTVALVFLGEVAGHLCKGLIRCQSDADRHSYVSFDFLMKFFAPCFQIQMLHAIKIDKALVDAVAEIGWSLLADDWNHTACQFAIQLIVWWEYDNLLIGKLLCQLEIRCSGFDAHFLGFIWPCHYATVIVRENNDRLVLQIWSKDALAWYVTVIAVNDAVHESKPLFPAFDSPNYHAPHFKVIICIDTDRLEVLVGRT